MDVQKRIKTSTVLVCGLSVLGSEICKNLILSGVNMVIQDSELVTEKDLGSNLYITENHLHKNRATSVIEKIHELNPLVTVKAITKPLYELKEEELKLFSIICTADLNTDSQIFMNNMCRKLNIKFFSSASIGFCGYVFCDLGDNYEVYVKQAITSDDKNSNEISLTDSDQQNTVKYKTVIVKYCSLQDALSVNIKQLCEKYKIRKRKFSQVITACNQSIL